jgi:exopolysaccharide production protein ExoZ
MQRIKELDYLRGIAAISIMCYHFMKWLHVYDGAQSFIGRWSVYGVEIFYLLSGITLFHVYHLHLKLEKESLLRYAGRRFFRIFPLFWLSILLTLIITLKQIDFLKLFINVSGLFGFVAWDKYIASGSWSIGNELVFYVIFPFLIFLYQNKRIYFALIGAILLCVFHYFAFYIFNPNDTLHNQWTNYIHPLNHLFLFYVGILIPIFFKNKLTNNYPAISFILIGSFMLFMFPSGKDGIHLLYGINRWIFSVGSILICLGFYQIKLNLPRLIDGLFQTLGEISYSVYLLHPIVYQVLCMVIRKIQPYGLFPKSNSLLIVVAILCTLVISKITYKYFEIYFIKKGKLAFANFYKS